MPIKQNKEKEIGAYIIKNKKLNTPWTMKIYATPKSAWEDFEMRNKLFGFDKNSFEVVPCLITYKLTPTK